MIDRIRTLAGLAVMAGVLTSAQARAAYTFTEVAGTGDSSGAGSQLFGINNNGDTVGLNTGSAVAGITSYIRKADGTYSVLTGPAFIFNSSPIVSAINNSDTVVGYNGAESFIQTTTSVTFPIQATGAQATFFLGINNAGTIVGDEITAMTGTTFGIIGNGTPSGFTLVNASDGTNPNKNLTTISAINNTGAIAGYYSDDDGITQHLFISSTASPSSFTHINDPFGTTFAQVNGISDSGLIVGFYLKNPATGLVDGFIGTPTGTPGVYTYTDIVDPNATAGSSTLINGINASGEISGYWIGANGFNHAFIASPSGDGVVPEPSSIILLGLGALSVVAARKRLRTA